jgi:hypothetical protein
MDANGIKTPLASVISFLVLNPSPSSSVSKAFGIPSFVESSS